MQTIREKYLAQIGSDIPDIAARRFMEDLMASDPDEMKAGYTKENAALAAHEVFPEVELEYLKENPVTGREKCESYAGLVFNVGTMIEDRLENDLTPEESDRLWAYLYENSDSFYELVGPRMDAIVEELFPEKQP